MLGNDEEVESENESGINDCDSKVQNMNQMVAFYSVTFQRSNFFSGLNFKIVHSHCLIFSIGDPKHNARSLFSTASDISVYASCMVAWHLVLRGSFTGCQKSTYILFRETPKKQEVCRGDFYPDQRYSYNSSFKVKNSKHFVLEKESLKSMQNVAITESNWIE